MEFKKGYLLLVFVISSSILVYADQSTESYLQQAIDDLRARIAIKDRLLANFEDIIKQQQKELEDSNSIYGNEIKALKEEIQSLKDQLGRVKTPIVNTNSGERLQHLMETKAEKELALQELESNKVQSYLQKTGRGSVSSRVEIDPTVSMVFAGLKAAQEYASNYYSEMKIKNLKAELAEINRLIGELRTNG